MARIAMIGATGLIGGQLAPLLVADGHELLIVGRRASGIAGAREIVAPVAEWDDALSGEGVDIGISTLGTTRRAAGSREAFEAVDRHAVVDFARAAGRGGARHWMMVSSVGAHPGSRNPYLRTKGLAEADVRSLGFKRIDIFRPGLLKGRRVEKRPMERLAMMASPLFNLLLGGPLDCYQSIPASEVALAMATLARHDEAGSFVHLNREIRDLAEKHPAAEAAS